MAINENIVTGRKFRKLVDEANKLWQRISFWTKASDVEFDDGSTAEIKVGAINGVTDSLTSTSSNIAASAAAVKALNDKVTELNSNLGSVYYLGSGSGTYNISGIPNYNNFSSANFIVCTSSAYAEYRDNVNKQTRSTTAGAVGYSYNPSNGILTVNGNNEAYCDTSNTTIGSGYCKAISHVGAVYLVTGDIKNL